MKNLVKFLLIAVAWHTGFTAAGAENEANAPSAPWCNSLAYGGGGYWTKRLPVIVQNRSGHPLKGDQFRLILSGKDGMTELTGIPVCEIRVANEKGIEYRFELQDRNKKRKRTGTMAEGDILTVPVEAGTDSSTTIYIYAGNPEAWLPPDIRDFTDNPDWQKRSVNEWLEVKEDKLLSFSEIKVFVLSVENRELTVEKPDSAWISGLGWSYRIPVYVRNFTDRNIEAGVTMLKTRRIKNQLGKLLGFDVKPALCLVDPANPGRPLDLSGSLEENIRAMFRINAMTEKVFWLYAGKDSGIKDQSRFVDLFPEIHNTPGLVALAGQPEARDEQSWPVTVWPVSSLIKVFHGDLPPENKSDHVHVYASRNSGKSFQIALRTTRPVKVSIKITPLKNAEGGELPAPDMYRVGYVPVDFPVRYYRTPKVAEYIRYHPERAGSDGWAGWWPDPLIPVENGYSFKMKANSTLPVWFDLHIPAGAAPGVYAGHVVIESGSGKIYMPVQVKVWKLVLPDKRHIPVVYDLRRGPGKNPFGKNMPDEKEWSRYLARFNVSPGMLAEPVFTYKNGKVRMDTKEFDEMAHLLFDELNNTMMYTPGLFFSVGWYSGAKPVFGLQPFTPEYVKAWKEAYRLFIDHITQKGWRKYFVLYLSDEPRIPLAFDAIARVSDMAREVAPDIPIYVSAWDYVDEIAGHITAWGIGAQGQFPAYLIKERKAAGDIFIYTTDGQQSLDTPFPATERLMPWFCFKYGVKAFEFWGSTWWTFDPWKYGWHAFVKESGGEEVINPVRYPNGDGYIVYPGNEIGVNGPVPSLRLIAIREGVDDYEIFHALEAYAKKGQMDAVEILNKVHELVIVPNRGGMWATSFMPDPEAVSTARIQAGEILDRIMTR